MLRVNKTSPQHRAEKRGRKASFYLCEGRQNNLFTPECVLCLEFFPSIVITCYLNHQIDMKRSFHVLLSPEGIWTTCLSFALSESGDKPICHPFFLPGCVWSELTSKTWSLMRRRETVFRCTCCVDIAKAFFLCSYSLSCNQKSVFGL